MTPRSSRWLATTAPACHRGAKNGPSWSALRTGTRREATSPRSAASHWRGEGAQRDGRSTRRCDHGDWLQRRRTTGRAASSSTTTPDFVGRQNRVQRSPATGEDCRESARPTSRVDLHTLHEHFVEAVLAAGFSSGSTSRPAAPPLADPHQPLPAGTASTSNPRRVRGSRSDDPFELPRERRPRWPG